MKPPESLPISVIILAHQNDSRLLAALNSVAWSAEIIIIWSGIAKLELSLDIPQIRIISSQKKISDFANLRNISLEEAQYEWVFFLDSDEVFDETGIPQLERLISNPLIDGATVRRRDVFLQQEMKHGETGHVSLVRLLRRQKAKFERKVHEFVVIKGHIAKTNLVIYHFSHKSIADFLSKIILYIQLEQAERAEQKQRFHLREMLIFPSAKFIQNYFLRCGFRDGWRGLIYATMMSIHSFGVRASLYEQGKNDKNSSH
jgi:hypothetical protein